MLYIITLVLHVAAACVTGILALFAAYIAAGNKTAAYRPAALALAGVAAFQIFSGTVLAIVSPELSAAALSLHIIGYLGACVAVEALLFVKMKSISIAFPIAAAASPVLASLTLWISSVYLQY